MTQIVEEMPSANRGAMLEKIYLEELVSTDKQRPKISQVQTIATFNWLRVGDSQVITPGMPPKWTPLDKPHELQQDSGIFYRDKNDANYPNHPTEPAVEIVMKMDSRPKAPTDLVACAATLDQLLPFARGDRASFRILVDRIGNTVHFIRRLKSPRETIPDIKGYGHTFPESYTTWDDSVQGSSSHQRVIQYRFGELTCQLRFEGDGYLPEKIDGPLSVEKYADTTAAHCCRGDSGGHDGLLNSLAPEPAMTASGAPLKISTAGSKVPHDALFDLKTRSVSRKPYEEAIIDQELRRLWIRQMPTLILAYHERGTFNDIKILDVRDRVAEWERMNTASIAQFQKLLQRIVSICPGPSRW
ncbi:hypothetical protein LLEC1_01896 [Akanthomyces lecanii]|uniref:Geranylgeranyl pyrophosphate synthetase n=1 Tax=Cordyceps confragosa TaxID=2714763 RepID=A0A179I742_CORDF|nr:hypothetical protein LLEC1_01896 [Akanthomyces lecanii]